MGFLKHPNVSQSEENSEIKYSKAIRRALRKMEILKLTLSEVENCLKDSMD